MRRTVKACFVLLVILLFPISASAIEGSSDDTIKKGSFSPLPCIEVDGITVTDYEKNGLTRASLVFMVGLSMNLDEDTNNDVDLGNVTNKYTVSFRKNEAIITFNTDEVFASVTYHTGGEGSYYFSINQEFASDGIKSILLGPSDSLYVIDMDDFSDAIYIFLDSCEQ